MNEPSNDVQIEVIDVRKKYKGREEDNMEENKKYCKHCGELIDKDCIICPKCGKQVEELKRSSESIIINNTNTASVNTVGRREKNKWIAFLLCFFLGGLGAHKFYEG